MMADYGNGRKKRENVESRSASGGSLLLLYQKKTGEKKPFDTGREKDGLFTTLSRIIYSWHSGLKRPPCTFGFQPASWRFYTMAEGPSSVY
jgi:hypothetical protein